jgi:hypothetical protein
LGDWGRQTAEAEFLAFFGAILISATPNIFGYATRSCEADDVGNLYIPSVVL